MVIIKSEYFSLKMDKQEAEQFLMLIKEISHSNSGMPDWAKAQAIELARNLERSID